jgi:CheY-like chemotaxis protein
MGGARGTILIVEDDADIRETLASTLENFGYGVTTARNGREALELLARLAPRPRLILLDMMMPVMGGLEFLAAQRADQDIARVPVVVVSAYSAVAQSAGAQEFLSKPVDLDDLLACAARYCGGSVM